MSRWYVFLGRGKGGGSWGVCGPPHFFRFLYCPPPPHFHKKTNGFPPPPHFEFTSSASAYVCTSGKHSIALPCKFLINFSTPKELWYIAGHNRWSAMSRSPVTLFLLRSCSQGSLQGHPYWEVWWTCAAHACWQGQVVWDGIHGKWIDKELVENSFCV